MLCVAQMGWLHAVPKPPHTKGSKAPREKRSRLEQLKAKGLTPHMPPLELGVAELELFMQVGPALHTGTGTQALPYTELDAYVRLCGVNLQPWQARLLHGLSRHYVHHLVKGEDPSDPAPFVDVRQVKRDAVSQRLGAMFKSLASGAKK